MTQIVRGLPGIVSKTSEIRVVRHSKLIVWRSCLQVLARGANLLFLRAPISNDTNSNNINNAAAVSHGARGKLP